MGYCSCFAVGIALVAVSVAEYKFELEVEDERSDLKIQTDNMSGTRHEVSNSADMHLTNTSV